MRQIVLDTETTGLEVSGGHRIIEIGGVEVDNRRRTGAHFHRYLNPDREIDAGAQEVHGITLEFLADKPRFEDVVDDFLAFVDGAELIIHNAEFDLQFLDAELDRARRPAGLGTRHPVIDTLLLARTLHPGQRNSLDALCRRYGIDNTHRELHGALLDAEILADVYLAMSGGQTGFSLADEADDVGEGALPTRRRWYEGERPSLRVVHATAAELSAHEALLDRIAGASDGALWRPAPPATGPAD